MRRGLVLVLGLGLGLAAGLGAAEGPGLGDRLLGGRAGLLLAMEPATGRLLLRTDRRGFRGPLPIGSLVKPFTLVAWSRRHPVADAPVAHCSPGGPPRCWFVPGHGRVDLPRSLEVSCNHYLGELAGGLRPGDLDATLRDFGLDPPLDELSAEAHQQAGVGLGEAVRYEPQAVLEAYVALLAGGRRFRAARRHPVFLGRVPLDAAVAGVLDRGLAASAWRGTGKGARAALPGVELLTKTGTAVRLDARGRALDRGTSAWFVGLAPRAAPRLAVLVHLEAGTGSHDAAPLGGRLLAALWPRADVGSGAEPGP